MAWEGYIVHPLGLRGGLEEGGRERERERADGNGNAVSGEMRKGGRKGDGEGERERERESGRASEAIRYMPPPPSLLPLLQLPGKNVRLPVLRFLLLLSSPSFLRVPPSFLS